MVGQKLTSYNIVRLVASLDSRQSKHEGFF
jgi:hypothetical protein